jgi:hypothetical protein
MSFEDASDVCLGCGMPLCTMCTKIHFHLNGYVLVVLLIMGLNAVICILLAKHLTGYPADDIFLLSGRHDAALLTGRPRKNIGQGFIRMPTKLHQNETSEGTALQGLEIAKVIDGWRRQVCKNS